VEEGIVNATAFHLNRFFAEFVHVGPQDTQLTFYLYVNDELNITDDYTGYYSNFQRRERYKV